MRSYLDFEKPVAELDARLDELRALAESGSDCIEIESVGWRETAGFRRGQAQGLLGGSDMEQTREEVPHIEIETTIGDLICAIADAAREASIDEQDVNKLTHFILMNILRRER